MTNKNYTKKDLINDASFRRMVKGVAAPEEVNKWSNWMEENDGNRKIVKEAISEIVGFEFREPQSPDIEKEWSALYSRTVKRTNVLPKSKHKGVQHLGWIARAVAILLLASMAVLFSVHFFADNAESPVRLEQLTEERTITTGENEQKTLSFSNGSKIVLNSNTTLTYSLAVLRNQTTDVTLEGEAWFDVVNGHSNEKSAFAVHTPDGIIRDIGTQFLVTVEQGRSRVVLQEGIVEVEPADQDELSNGGQKKIVRLEPGEMLEFSRSAIQRRERVNTTFYTAWATQYMEFDRTSIQEFANYVEQRFDVTVEIGDPELSDITLDGAVYFRSLEELVRSVSVVTGIPVYQSENRKTVFIGVPE